MLRGMFALAQYVWHCDVVGECHCGTGEGCGTCVDETPRPEKLKRSPIMGSNKKSPVEARETKSVSVADTVIDGSRGYVRKHRIYSRILMSSIGEPLWAAHSVWEFLEALHDAILGYWRLVNLGILHRDISDGNVMLLRGPQGYQRRKWLEEEERNVDVEGLKEEFGEMAESESELRKVLNELKRDPKGMVSDFDLHTRHALPHNSNDGAASGDKPNMRSPTPRSDAPSKRRKTGTGSSVPATAPDDVKGKGKARQSAAPTQPNSHSTPEFGEGRRLVDFRTGTPTFMSIRVLETTPGVRYKHNFMDDLQSFFWLLLWSVAIHLDPRGHTRPGARRMLDSLEQFDLEAIAQFKTTMLTKSFAKNGREMRERLLSLENSWVGEPIISLAISLGSFFFSEATLNDSSTCDPSVVFPQVITMISEALNKRPPE